MTLPLNGYIHVIVTTVNYRSNCTWHRMLLVYVISILVVYFTFKVWNYKNIKRNAAFERLPGKKGHFLLGNSLDFLGPRDGLLKLYDKFIKDYQSEGLAKVWLGNAPCVILFRAHTIEPLASSQVHIQKSDLYRFTHPWLGLGLLTSAGKKWFQRRKMLTPTFHFRILEDFLPTFNEQGAILAEKFSTHVGTVYYDIYKDITLCTLDIICATAMGVDLKAQTQPTSDYVEAVNITTELINKRFYLIWYQYDLIFNLSPIGRKCNSAIQIQHDFTNKVIKEKKEESRLRKSQQENESNVSDAEMVFGGKRRVAFLDLLLDISEDGKVLSDQDIREEVDTFMFEGHDTTASGIYWTLYLLGLNPDVQKKVHEELDTVFGESLDSHVNKEHLQELKYLECVCKESLRICTPVPVVARQLHEDLTIGDYMVPAGVICLIFPYFLHRDEKYFPDPEKFDPDRFLPENSKGRSPYAYLPFSAGPRNCIGQKFALMEEKVVLANILRKYEVTTESIPQFPEGAYANPTIICKPSSKCKIHIRRRNI